jgi:hypothetical protein
VQNRISRRSLHIKDCSTVLRRQKRTLPEYYECPAGAYAEERINNSREPGWCNSWGTSTGERGMLSWSYNNNDYLQVKTQLAVKNWHLPML